MLFGRLSHFHFGVKTSRAVFPFRGDCVSSESRHGSHWVKFPYLGLMPLADAASGCSAAGEKSQARLTMGHRLAVLRKPRSSMSPVTSASRLLMCQISEMS